jgi:hypothetical protein
MQLGLELLKSLEGHRHFFHGLGSHLPAGAELAAGTISSLTQTLEFSQTLTHRQAAASSR